METGNKNQEELIAHKAFEIKRRAGDMITAYIDSLVLPEEGAADIEALKFSLQGLVPEAGDLQKYLIRLKGAESREEFLKEATEVVINILAENLSLEELEKRILQKHLEKGYENPIRGLTYEKVNGVIYLHVPVTFFESPKEALQSFSEGLRLLAKKILDDKAYSDVTEIIGHSSLVKEKAHVLTRMGFTITPGEDSRPSDEAKMSKETLLKLYS